MKDARGSRDRWVLRERNVISPIPRKYTNLVFEKASGIEIKSADGRSLIDLTGGFHVGLLGYSHPSIIEATKEQLERLDYIPHYMGTCPIRVELAEELLSLSPRRLRKGLIAYCNTGSDAAEFAIKLARYSTGRKGLVSCLGAYHGGTMGGLSITTAGSRLRSGYAPFLPDVYFVRYPDAYRDHVDGDPQSCWVRSIDELEFLFDEVVKPEEIAALFIEPIQAHGGVLIPPSQYFKKLRQICSKYEILLFADEVVTGFGRTGRMFGMEHHGVEPDAMFLGKPMGGGLPLGAVVGRREIMERWTADGPASTLAASTIACARAFALLQTIVKENLLANARRVGQHIVKRFSEMSERLEIIGDVRGKGLMIGVELVKDRRTKAPATKETRKILEGAYRKGVILESSGRFGNVLKLTPPLIITELQADRALEVMGRCMNEEARKT